MTLSDDSSGVAALEAGVVVDADAGEERHLLAAKARDPPVAAVVRKPGLVRGDLGPTRGQEFAKVGAGGPHIEATSGAAG